MPPAGGGSAKPMLDSDDSALWFALNRLMTNYWAEVDENGGAAAHEFYLPDAVYAIGNNRFEGRDKIRAFYERRRYSQIMTRHLISNLRVFQDQARRARAIGVMSLYRADGKSPFQGARPPAMIADFEAKCVRSAVAPSIARTAAVHRRWRPPGLDRDKAAGSVTRDTPPRRGGGGPCEAWWRGRCGRMPLRLAALTTSPPCGPCGGGAALNPDSARSLGSCRPRSNRAVRPSRRR